MRNFTREELEELTAIATNGGKVDNRFETARGKNGWIRGLVAADSIRIYEIYKGATGVKRAFYPNCGICVLRMMKEVGIKYFADLEAIQTEEVTIEKPKRKSKNGNRKTQDKPSGGEQGAN